MTAGSDPDACGWALSSASARCNVRYIGSFRLALRNARACCPVSATLPPYRSTQPATKPASASRSATTENDLVKPHQEWRTSTGEPTPSGGAETLGIATDGLISSGYGTRTFRERPSRRIPGSPTPPLPQHRRVRSYPGDMTWWDKFKEIVKSEAADARDGLAKLGRTLDDELARKERELAATPSERIDMLLEDVGEEDARFEELEEKVRSLGADDVAIDDRARMLPDQEASAEVAAAMEWIDVAAARPQQDAVASFDHAVAIDDLAYELIGEEAQHALADTVEQHPLVLDARIEGAALLVLAPALHPEDVRMVVARALAEVIPPDWEQRLQG